MDYPLSAVVHPSLVVSLTDVFNKEDWLEIFDYLLAHPYSPWMYVCILLEMVKMVEASLLKSTTVEKIAATLRKEKNLNVKDLIARAGKTANNDKKVLKEIYSDTFFPISKERYPIINFMPKKR